MKPNRIAKAGLTLPVAPVYQTDRAEGGMMPDFMGIGAQKCGTTWIFENLSRHPSIRFPAGKEVHFWNRHRELGIDWWLQLFPAAPSGVKQGEITPAYAMLPPAVIQDVRRAVPSLRIFYSLRNPIERAWSAALMALRLADMQLDEASDQWFLDHFRSAGSRRRSNYLQCLDHWLSVFDPEQVLILLLDDIQTEPRAVLARLARHIGVDPVGFDLLSDALLTQPVFEGLTAPIRPTLRDPLRAMYQDMIESLSARLNRNLSHWLA